MFYSLSSHTWFGEAVVAGVFILGVWLSEQSGEPAPGELLSPPRCLPGSGALGAPYAAGAHAGTAEILVVFP